MEHCKIYYFDHTIGSLMYPVVRSMTLEVKKLKNDWNI